MSDIADLKRFGKVLKYPKGTFLFQQGEKGQEMFIILTGKVSVNINSSVGEHIMLAELAPGAFVGEMSVLEEMPRSASVRAEEETIVLAVHKDNIINFLANKPEWAFKVMQSLSNRIRKLNERLFASSIKEEDVAAGVEKMMPTSEINTASSIFPEGHGQYEGRAGEEDGKYLYEKKIECPICNREFPVLNLKSTKLRLKEVTKDFREIHEGFDKLWYNIWVCPSCYYANFYFDFLDIEKRPAEKLAPLLAEFKQTNHFVIDNHIQEINQVFLFYYLAINTKKLLKKIDYKVGKLWINLSWLYDDVKDQKMYDFAYNSAYENYTFVMYKTRTNISQQESQRLYILLGEMTLYRGDKQEALKYFQSAIKADQKTGMADRARDRIYDIREQIKQEKAEAEANGEATEKEDGTETTPEVEQ